MGIELPQSIPICAALSGAGGILEVFATAVLAYPAAKIAEGYAWSDLALQVCLGINIVLQIMASLSGNLFATWYGPVAVVGPIFFAAQLLANLIVYYVVLGIEAFSKEMRIGTYIIALAVTMLLANGPTTQDYGDTELQELISELYSALWLIVLLASMAVTGGIVVWTAKLSVDNFKKRSVEFRIIVLLVARASSFAINLSTGKAMVMETTRPLLIACIILKIVSGMIYTMAIVVQSTTVPQKIFVPMNAATAIFVNAITGMLVWRDYQVIQSWTGYVGVFLLLVLGCNLLLGDLQLLGETSPELFRGNRVSMAFRENRHQVLEEIKRLGKSSSLEEGDDDDNEEEQESDKDVEDHQKPLPSSPARSQQPLLVPLTQQQEAWAKIFERSKAVPKHAVAERTKHYEDSNNNGEDTVLFFPSHMIPPALRGGAGRRQQRLHQRSGAEPPQIQRQHQRGASESSLAWLINQPLEWLRNPPVLGWLLHPQPTTDTLNETAPDGKSDDEEQTTPIVQGKSSSIIVGQFEVPDEHALDFRLKVHDLLTHKMSESDIDMFQGGLEEADADHSGFVSLDVFMGQLSHVASSSESCNISDDDIMFLHVEQNVLESPETLRIDYRDLIDDVRNMKRMMPTQP